MTRESRVTVHYALPALLSNRLMELCDSIQSCAPYSVSLIIAVSTCIKHMLSF